MSCHAAEHHLEDIILPMQILSKKTLISPLLLVIKGTANVQPGPERLAGGGGAQRAATPFLLHVTLAGVMMEMEGHRRRSPGGRTINKLRHIRGNDFSLSLAAAPRLHRLPLASE